ncbi:MAG: ureF family protein [Caulobacter sp.]|nr:ureF family protein [Caulobacter sp.]
MGPTILATITMTTSPLLRLLTWLSPAFPVGSFSYSHGLERAIHDGWVKDAETLHDWLDGLVSFGGGWTDAVLVAEAHTAIDEPARLADVAELAEALAISRERLAETLGQGAAFLAAARAWPEGSTPLGSATVAYPVAVGATCASAGIGLDDTLTAYIHAFAGNLVTIAMRAIPLGQTDGMAVMARLEPAILAIVARAAVSTLDDLGSAALNSDLMALAHETQHVRLFIS